MGWIPLHILIWKPPDFWLEEDSVRAVGLVFEGLDAVVVDGRPRVQPKRDCVNEISAGVTQKTQGPDLRTGQALGCGLTARPTGSLILGSTVRATARHR